MKGLVKDCKKCILHDELLRNCKDCKKCGSLIHIGMKVCPVCDKVVD